MQICVSNPRSEANTVTSSFSLLPSANREYIDLEFAAYQAATPDHSGTASCSRCHLAHHCAFVVAHNHQHLQTPEQTLKYNLISH